MREELEDSQEKTHRVFVGRIERLPYSSRFAERSKRCASVLHNFVSAFFTIFAKIVKHDLM
jgi:RecB family exonuclease